MDEMGSPFGVVSKLINNYSYLTFSLLDFKGEDLRSASIERLADAWRGAIPAIMEAHA